MQKPLRPVAPDSSFIKLPAADHPVTNPVFRFRTRCMDKQSTERSIFPTVHPDKIKLTLQSESVLSPDDTTTVF